MRQWTLAILYAAVTAAVFTWFDADASFGADFVQRTGVLVLPLRLAVHLESRCGACWLSRIWS